MVLVDEKVICMYMDDVVNWGRRKVPDQGETSRNVTCFVNQQKL